MRRQIVVDFGFGLEGYCEHFDELGIPQRDCPICQALGSLIGHGSYPRHPLDATHRYEALGVRCGYQNTRIGFLSQQPVSAQAPHGLAP